VIITTWNAEGRETVWCVMEVEAGVASVWTFNCEPASYDLPPKYEPEAQFQTSEQGFDAFDEWIQTRVKRATRPLDPKG
jgi:hypothetical protein